MISEWGRGGQFSEQWRRPGEQAHSLLGRDGEHGALIGWCSMRLVILFLVAGTEGQADSPKVGGQPEERQRHLWVSMQHPHP